MTNRAVAVTPFVLETSSSRALTIRGAALTCVLFIIALLGTASQAIAANGGPGAKGPLDSLEANRTANTVAKKTLPKLPLRFEDTGDGQAMAVRLGGRQLRLGKAGAVESRSATGEVLSITLEGANQDATPFGQAQLPGRSNYFIGRDVSKWRKGVEQFSQARVQDVYDGIDLLYYGSGTELEHDYLLAPGSDSTRIRMRITGGTSRIDGGTGDLIVAQGDTKQELVRLVRPVAYQTYSDGSRVLVKALYAQNENGSFGFTLGEYDRALPLTIDPVVTYSSYFGGSNNDEVNDIKTDTAGNLVLLVASSSTDLPVVSQIADACVGTCGPTNPSPNGGAPRTYDFYLAKLDPAGQTLLYSTYIGGTGSDYPGALVIAPDGTLYISGTSDSLDFPVVNGYPSAIPDYRYYNSATLTKLSADGSTILYSSLIGAGLVDSFESSTYSSAPGSLAVGANGIAYVIGNACCGRASFLDAKNTSFTAGGGSFIAKFDTTKSGNDSLLYATTFGQPGDIGGENLQAIAIDSKQNLWAFGEAYASDASKPNPTSDAVQPICDGGGQCGNAFFHGLTPDGAIFYTSFLGGTMNPYGGPGFETPVDIVIDSSDNIYLSGTTESVDFPLKNAAFPYNGTYPGFLTKLSPGAKSILYSTYEPNLLLLANLPDGRIAAAGGANFAVPQVNAIPPAPPATEPNINDVAFEVFDTTKSGSDSLLVSSYLGSPGTQLAEALSVDGQGNLLIGGVTGTKTLLLVNPYKSSCDTCGYPDFASDGFVARVRLANGSLTLTPATQSFPDTSSGTSSPTQTSTLTNATSAAITLSTGTLDATDFSASDNCNGTIASGASCTVTFTFTPQSDATLTSTYSIYDVNNPSSPLSVALSGTGTAPPTPQATLTPSSADFDSIAAGSTSPAQIFTLTNAGNAALPITSTALAGADAASFTIAGNTCGTSLAANTSCKLAVTFSPTTAGSDAATLNITDSIGTQTAALTGTSFAAAPKATVTPASVDFGTYTLGIPGNPQTITLTNTGNTALPFTSFAITGANASSFQVRNGSCPKSLPAAATCPIDVIFLPTTAGAAVAALRFTDSLGTQSATLTGKAIYASATLVLAPGATNNFGNVTVGAQAVAAIRLNNTSQVPITLTGASINGTAFKVDSSGSCAAPISPNSLCEASVTFNPTAVGPAAATLSITTDVAGVLTLPFTGTGVPPTATLTPAPYDFGRIHVGASSGLITFLLINTSPVPIRLIDSSVTGSAFRLGAKAGTLAPGTSAKYLVAFTPTVTGAATGTLSVISDAGTATSALTGTGIAPEATLSPSVAALGNATVGTSNVAQSFTLTNAGTAPLSLNMPTLTGTNAASFVISENQCVSPIAAGTSCTIGVTFMPTSAGPASVTLNVTDDVGTQSATITAAGVLPTMTVTPPSLDFGSVPVGATVTKTITYTNTSPVSILLKSQSVTGGVGEVFLQTPGSTCSAQSTGVDLIAAGSCTFTFEFTPTAATSYSGTLIRVDSAGTQTITFTGQGMLPTLAITPTTLAFGNVPVGTTVDQTVTFTNSSTVPITFTGNATPSGDFGTVFSPTPANTCVGKAIAAGISCTLGFSFTPAATASYSGTLAFTDNAGTQTLTFTGTGFVDGPKLVLSPATYSFGAVPAGSSPTETVTLTNTGTQEASFVYGNSVVSNGLQIAATGNTCGTTLASGASCTIPVQLTGADTGSAQLTIDIAGNSGTNSVAASLIGFGAAGGPPPTFIDLGNGFTTGALALNGPAIAANGVLQLTAGQTSQTSSAFYSTPVSAITFSTDFAFHLLDPLAEGLTFTLQANAPNAIGTGGGDLGYQGIAKSIALKLDLRDTAGEGDNSTGIYVNGAAPTVPATTLADSGIDLHSGHVFTLHIDYDGTTESIILTDTATGAVWKTQAAEDIPTLIGSDTAYFGFTASTEAATTNADTVKPSARPLAAAANATANTTTSILDWTYTTAPAPATLIPASLDFGTHVVGGLSTNQSATLTNTGVAPIQVVSVTPSDPQIQIPGGSGNCIGTLTPGQTCTFSLFYSPFVTGPFSGLVAVKYFLGDGSKANENFTVLLKVTGTGVATTLVRISPSPVDFGSVDGFDISAPHTLTVTNDGGVTTTLSGITLTETFGTDTVTGGFFRVADGATCVNGTVLAPTKSCTVPVVFAPQYYGEFSGTFSVSYSDADAPGGTQTTTSALVAVSHGILHLDPVSFNFGDLPAGTYKELDGDIRNVGLMLFQNITFSGLDGVFGFPFPYVHLQDCTNLIDLFPSRNCGYRVVVGPTQTGPVAGTFVISGTLAGAPYSVKIPITGRIVPNTHPPTISPATYDFGSTAAGDQSDVQTFTLTNPSSGSIFVGTPDPDAVFFRSNNPTSLTGPFTLLSTTCGATLFAGASCTASISFNPTATGAATGIFSFNTSAGTPTVALSGTGIAPLVVTPSPVAFGEVPVGAVRQTSFVLNSVAKSVLQYVTFGLPGGGFQILPKDDCPVDNLTISLVLSTGCHFYAFFGPAQPGFNVRFVTFTVVLNGVTTTVSAPLSATVVPNNHPPTVSPTTFNFGSTASGSTSAAQTFTLTNPSSDTISLGTSVGVNVLSVAGPFNILSSTCVYYLEAGQSCTASVTFSPTTAGTAAGTLTFNTGAGQETVALSGTGTTPDFTVTTTKANLTVLRGSSAKLVIDLGSSGNFTSPVTFTASGLPAGATATFAPSTLVPGSGISTTMTVSVPALASRNRPTSPFPPGGRNAAFGISAAALIASFFGFRRRLNLRLLLCLCALSLIGAITGCGSGAGFTIPTTNSSFTVTATSGSITHTISVTLTVQ